MGPQDLIHECDVAVIGGGLGGVAAALRACRAGQRVCLTEATAWLGGQVTSQGVSALDEHEHIETFGGTASYYELREGIRDSYRHRFALSEASLRAPHFNPGDGWVSRLCFEPNAGLIVILGLLLPEVEAGRLQILYRASPKGAARHGDEVRSVTVARLQGDGEEEIRAAYFLDATEMGDLLPLLDVPHVTGAEAREQTGEPHARTDGPAPHLTQAFTLPFAVDFRPGEDHTIPRPPNYERNRTGQPYTLTLPYGEGDLTYRVFEAAPDHPGAFWTYRRLLSSSQFQPGEVAGDLAMINWPGNDFKGGDLVGAGPQERGELVHRARELSLGFLHWLQTEVPRDDGSGLGYPEIRLRTDLLGTADGLAMFPYVRESRRLVARCTVREQDVSARCQSGARAAPFADSAGLGWYPIDIHGVPGDVATGGPTRPFQIPLGALIPRDGPVNLLAACKNTGVTHLTNGCYRLHPVEWNTGETAGALAAFCIGEGVCPAAVHGRGDLLRHFQATLLEVGVPLYWFTDVPRDHPAYPSIQALAVRGVWPGAKDHLRFGPDRALSTDERHRLRRACSANDDVLAREGLSTAQAAVELAAIISRRD